jgi:tRNA threonylcarbamoyladenosine biosynthesis protein TsaE
LPESHTTREFHTTSDEGTIELGRRIASLLPRRALVLLVGNLGAGKTTLAKGIVSGLGAAAPEEVSSPTFTLIHEYGSASARNLVYHIDLYRLDRAAEVATLGLYEILDRDAVVLIEWGERFPELFSEPNIEIHLTAARDNPNARRIAITGELSAAGPLN